MDDLAWFQRSAQLLGRNYAVQILHPFRLPVVHLWVRHIYS
ncbi:hypothetical protein [Deinococcus terrestris]|nr:hypothetical protein [Deinococcus terrestris]